LENLLAASRAGAVVLPASPGWYHGVMSLAGLVDFVVARILDQMEVPHELIPRWGQEQDHA
jgi:4-hydroxy-3-polyprenylbenzoate decarboxylase